MNKLTAANYRMTYKTIIVVFFGVAMLNLLSLVFNNELFNPFTFEFYTNQNWLPPSKTTDILVTACTFTAIVTAYRIIYLLSRNLPKGIQTVIIIFSTIGIALLLVVGTVLIIPMVIYSIIQSVRYDKKELHQQKILFAPIDFLITRIMNEREFEIEEAIKKFKSGHLKVKIGFYIISAVIIVLLAAFGSLGLLISTLLFITYWRFSYFYLSKINKIVSIDCDPELQLGLYFKLSKIVKRDFERSEIEVGICQSLNMMGQYQIAKSCLENMQLKRVTTNTLIAYYMTKFDSDIGMGETGQISSIQSNLLACLNNPRFKKNAKQIQRCLKAIDAWLAYQKSEYDLSYNIYFDLYSSAPLNELQVKHAFMLAKVEIAKKNLEQAVQWLNIVIDKGSKLFIASEAQTLLDGITKNERG